MGYYNVIQPCVVGNLHYVHPPVQPIEVDDDVAAPLVADGALQPYRPADVADTAEPVRLAAERAAASAEALAEQERRLDSLRNDEQPKPRRSRRRDSDGEAD